MKYVKLFVLYLYMNTFLMCFAKYCKLCSNHTLCKYTISGPSTLCNHYDYKSLLTESQVEDILSAINEIRSFVAMGLSKHLPPAANMRKVVWSEELATFAQRWVDQCTPSIQPDVHDECRDLVDAKVGQNIATVTDATAGISVKSFVEMWHMQLRYFSGNVSYYNSAVESKAQYFTQLIWADTYLVGCGKARFYVLHKNVSIERLVCNFAPKGNIKGKSVYVTGDAGTQCPNNTVRDHKWKGICNPQNEFDVTASSPTSKQASLTANLSNYSSKQEIDPVNNGLVQSKTSNDKNRKHRNQKIRHIFYNDTYVDPNNSRGRHFTISSRKHPELHRLHHHYKNKSNSGQYGNNKESENFENDYKEELPHNIEKATLANTLRTFFITANRSCNNNFRLCSRKFETSSTKCRLSNILSGQCTRKTYLSTKFVRLTFANNQMHNSYVFNTPKTWQTIALNEGSKCTCDTNCECLIGKCSTTLCPHEHVSVTPLTTKQLEDRRYYNLLPNVVVRRGDVTNMPLAVNGPLIRPQNVWPVKRYTTTTEYESQMNNEPKSYDNSENDYLYDDFRFNMHKRNAEGETFKPFWQVDNYQLNKNVQTKSLKYTTLPNKRSKKVKQTTSIKMAYTTEPITIKNNSSNIVRIQPITEKYLSFEELMHIKRFNDDKDLRRTPDESTNTLPKGFTTNTVFVRKKHCTRKRTCTWTEPTASDGKIIAGNRGQKTPPGYVDGCTRTSTCTRDFMERNKFQDMTSSSLESTPENESEDEDYCEKRSLERSWKGRPKEIQKKHINKHTLTDNWISKYHMPNSVSNPVTEYKLEETVTDSLISNHLKVTTAIEICDCDRNVRKKRNQNTSMQNINIAERKSNQNLSYKDIYKIVLGKSAISYRDGLKTSCIRKQCTCNAVSVKKICNILTLFTFVVNTYYLILPLF